jgi:D-alanyl-D-alanine carboxypeptidase
VSKLRKKYLLFAAVALVALVFTTACTKEEKKEKEKNKIDYLVLVNKYLHLPDDWEKNLELVDAKNAWDEDIQLEKETYEQYKKLEKALKDEGVIIKLDSVYRSVQAQEELWDRWSKDPEKGIEYAKKFAAVPGFSEHHTGLAVDICIEKDGELIADNDDMIAEREIFAKVHAKLADYGFILRYLENREDSTGYTYEPWHLRYIGDKEIAKEIMSKNITFEEYLDSVTDLKKTPVAAKYQIVKALPNKLKELYDNKISNSRYDITKIYITDKEKETLKDLKLGDKDVAFEVTYELLPSEGTDPKELTVTDGKYDEQLGWVKNFKRVGVLKYDNGNYSISNWSDKF